MKRPILQELPPRIDDPLVFFEERFRNPNPWCLATSQFERRKYRRQISAVTEFAHPQTILELGSAEGVFTELLLKEVPQAVIDSVEISRSAANRANTRLQDFRNRLTIHQNDIAEFLARDQVQRWDCVFWSECMHYVARSRTMIEFLQLLRRCLALVAPGGFLCSVNTTRKIPVSEERDTADCLHIILRFLEEQAHRRLWCNYIDYKDEDQCSWEYELWLFQVE